MRHPSRVGLYKSRKDRLRSTLPKRAAVLSYGHRNYQTNGNSASKLRIWLRKHLSKVQYARYS